MRDYSILKPQFWTGQTGRQIRQLGRDAQVLALYLLSCPAANMIGIYYLSLPTLCHETGLSPKGALKALQSLSEAQFAEYDSVSEVVWVLNMAKYQIAEQLDSKDKRCKGVWRELISYKTTKFFKPFYERYHKNFNLPLTEFLGASECPSEAPSKPLGSQDQDQDQDQEQEQRPGGRTTALPKSQTTWEAYSEAYELRHGVAPIRNGRTNALLCQLVDRLGAEEAPLVAAFYLRVDTPLYVNARHPPSLLVRDCESLRTQLVAGSSRAPMVGPKAFQLVPTVEKLPAECPSEAAATLSKILGRDAFRFSADGEGAA